MKAHNNPDNDRPNPAREDIEALLTELIAIRTRMVEDAAEPKKALEAVHVNYRESARNLLHYLSLRRHDLRPVQLRLAALGLSSLGRAESHVLATVDAVLEALHRLAGRSWQTPPHETPSVNFTSGQRLLAEHTEALLGVATPGRGVRIMVTVPSQAAREYTLVRDLLLRGMDCMRINCAHDDPATWLRMTERLRQAKRSVGRSCRIVMDLAGPKLRTGSIGPELSVARVRPRRDPYGRVLAPARIWLTADTLCSQPPSPADACVTVPAQWLGRLKKGERLHFTDARESARTWVVMDVADDGCWAEATKTAYLVPGTVLHHRPTKDEDNAAPIGALPGSDSALSLQLGDLLVVTRDLAPGRPATRDSAGSVLTPPTVGCTIPEVLDDVRAGETIWFDDGKIGAIVEQVEADRVIVRISHAPLKGAKLRADKGINLPDSDLRLSAMTDKDVEDLAFAAKHADVVELSFANTARDVELLQERLNHPGGRRPAIVLKIETRRGFENLPETLLTAMRWPCCGVMIARGDLAVECGFERLAEVQEEILWICEAAHIPVIWATQVLETMAKTGMPSRAEITDAAMGHRAECVMLNKGPHIVSAARALDDILRRMQEHQTKKRAMLRELRLARVMPEDRSPAS